MYKEILEKYGIQQTPECTAEVLSYNVGDILKCMIKAERLGSMGYLGELKVACADVLTMSSLLPEQLGYDLAELKSVGLERFVHRMKEISEV